MKTLNFILMLFVLAVVCLAADAAVPSAPSGPPPFNWTQVLIVPIVTAVFAALRMYSGKIPAPMIVIGAPVLGAVLDQLGAYAGWWDASGALGALLGANAVWLHQLGKQTGMVSTYQPPTSSDK